MPKSRNHSSIANRADTGTFDDQEMSDRLENRLNESNTIEVTVESRTRGAREPVEVSFDGNIGNVRSLSGRTYRVNLDDHTCDCPDYEHRQRRCRHIEAVDLAREQIAQGTAVGSIRDIEMNPNQTIQEYIENETDAEIDNQQRQYTDDQFFYTDHPEQFQADMERLVHEPIPYYHENVLNGSGVTFGVEIEFIEGNSNAIAAELYKLGICSHPKRQRYHSVGVPGKWRVERDGSVSNGKWGGELISPILKDTPKTWKQIEIVCEVAKKHGARVNFKTGGHIHIGAENSLDGKRQRWRSFFKMTAGFEEVYYRLAGGERGRFRGGGYAPSSLRQNRKGIQARMPEEGSTAEYQGIISGITAGKFQSINLRPFTGSKKTIEFRAFNGTLTPGIIQANVKFAAGIVNTAERSRIEQNEGMETADEDLKRGRIINEFETNNERSSEAMMRTLDVVCSRKEDKEHLLSVLVRNGWA